MKKVIGRAMLATPFVAIFIYGGISIGWIPIMGVFGVTIILLAWTAIAVYLNI